MSGFQDQQADAGRLRQRLDLADRRAIATAQEDVVIEHPRRLFLRSPNGTYWAVTANDDGTLATTNMGAKL